MNKIQPAVNNGLNPTSLKEPAPYCIPITLTETRAMSLHGNAYLHRLIKWVQPTLDLLHNSSQPLSLIYHFKIKSQQSIPQ